MGSITGIEWTQRTFNPWWGCQKVSPACDNCYAERDSLRYGQVGLWGPRSKRRTFGEAHWAAPLKWNRQAEESGERLRVFCASMADVYDVEGPVSERNRLWETIEATPWLDWQILTKRIGNAAGMVPRTWLTTPPPNVWQGISAVTQAELARDMPKLMKLPAAIRFLSAEPLLEDIDLEPWLMPKFNPCQSPLTQTLAKVIRAAAIAEGAGPFLDWAIIGGESGPVSGEHKSRPLPIARAQRVVDQCWRFGVPVFFKQGSQGYLEEWPRFKDFDSFPPALQIRQFPPMKVHL